MSLGDPVHASFYMIPQTLRRKGSTCMSLGSCCRVQACAVGGTGWGLSDSRVWHAGKGLAETHQPVQIFESMPWDAAG